jgi:ATP-dependent helicase HrpA
LNSAEGAYQAPLEVQKQISRMANSLPVFDADSPITEAMLRDQFWLREQQQRIEKDSLAGKEVADRLARWKTRLAESVERRRNRAANLPAIRLDTELPVAARATEIIDAIRNHPVVVLAGETGSGKSTQLPLICLQAGYGISGMIGHTQPRRIAARGVAARVAEQLGSPPGSHVGFKIRFGDQTGSQTLVKLMTDGILLAETASDRILNQYEVLIIDEAHERSLNIDFLLGYLKQLLPRRPDLRVVITSATIDTARFAEHFTSDPSRPVPVIQVEGRTWPVEILYRPRNNPDDGLADGQLEQHTIDAIREAYLSGPGDVLVFLPTEQAIRSLSRKLRGELPSFDVQRSTEIVPLYARLATEQQNSVFRPGGQRRIVLATNVAESSITVPRIRFVVDQGLARISRYAPRSKVQRLPIEPVSRASASQRAGRCGRVGPGICIRLYDEEDFHQRPRYTTPEIRRTNLASVILQTRALHLGPIEEFPFIDPPGADAVRDGYKTLFEIGAIDEQRGLTGLGKKLSRLPVDPRVGRVLMAGNDFGCLEEMLIIASALEVQDPRVRPFEQLGQADQAHAQWQDQDSDFTGLLVLWDWLHDRRETLSNSQFRRACAGNFLSFVLVQQWLDVYRQLRDLCREHRMHLAHDRQNYASIHQALLTGFLSGVAMQLEGREYLGAGGLKFVLWPGSGVVRSPSRPQWILAGEVLETTQRFGRMIARIDQDWIESLATHLVKRSHSDPFWSRRRQSAMVMERVSLFGLPVVTGRPVRLGPIDPVSARRLFIDQGLVEGDMRTLPPFLSHNRKQLDEIREMAARTRQRELVIDDYVIRNFYERRLPASVYDAATLADALRADRAIESQLQLTAADLVGEAPDLPGREDFPDSIVIDNLDLPVRYQFAPGTIDDGVSVQVPFEAVSRLHDNHLGWAVPGLLVPRIVALIRSLPKTVRRNLVPAPDTAKRIADSIQFGTGPFYEVIARELSRIAGEPVTVEMFRTEKLEDPLRLNVQVVGEGGEVLCQSRDLEEIRQQLPGAPMGSMAAPDLCPEWNQERVIDWTWDEFPGQVVVRRGPADVPMFPALIDRGDHVQLRLLDHAALAAGETRLGLATLYRLAHSRLIRSHIKWLPRNPLLAASFERLMAAETASRESPRDPLPYPSLDEQLGQLLAVMAFVDGREFPGNANEFRQRHETAGERTAAAIQQIAQWLPKIMELAHKVTLQLPEYASRWPDVVADIRSQTGFLFGHAPLYAIPSKWLQHYPRYLEAILLRLDRIKSGQADRDRASMQQVAALTEQFERSCEEHRRLGSRDPELEYYGWMIQELRVSLFAQQLGTSETVSFPRLEKQWKRTVRYASHR